MKRIRLIVLSIFSFFGIMSLNSCTKVTPLPLVQAEVVTPRCVTSTGDFILCEELAAFEANVLENGGTRVGYPYKWFYCTAIGREGQSVPGGKCDPYPNGGCQNMFGCTPCANC